MVAYAVSTQVCINSDTIMDCQGWYAELVTRRTSYSEQWGSLCVDTLKKVLRYFLQCKRDMLNNPNHYPLRLLDTYAAKTHENWPHLHVSLNNSVIRPSFKIFPNRQRCQKYVTLKISYSDLNVTVRFKVNYNMNAIRKPSEPMGGDLEYSESEYWHLVTVPLPDLVPLSIAL